MNIHGISAFNESVKDTYDSIVNNENCPTLFENYAEGTNAEAAEILSIDDVISISNMDLA